MHKEIKEKKRKLEMNSFLYRKQIKYV